MKLDELRTKAQLVAWAESDARRKRAAQELGGLADAIAEGEKERDGLARETAAARDETERQRERLAQLRAKDASGLIDREKQTVRRVEELKRLESEAEGAAKAARDDADGTERRADAARARQASAKELSAALEEARFGALHLAQEVRLVRSQADAARTMAHRAEAEAVSRRREVSAAVEELEDLRLKMREAGVDGSLEKKIVAVEKRIRACEAAERELHERRGGIVRQLEALAERREAVKRAEEQAAAQCGELAKRLAPRLKGMAIEEYVRTACPEAVAAPVDFSALRERFAADAKVCEAVIALRIRDAKGEAYAFSFDVAANEIADRRGTRLSEVIADETRRLEELRSVIDRKVKSMGSGGEQAVPNYLLILTVAEFLYHGSESGDQPKAVPLLFDEAFYGIDAARRDQLLAFAEELGLQLFVSSPDQDGVKREIRHSVSLIVVKDENLDVHLSPVTWRNAAVQTGLFDGEAPKLGMTVGEETR